MQNYNITMPVVEAPKKVKLPELTPIMVQDTTTGAISTVIIANRAVVWFEPDGQIQKSDLEHLMECTDYVIVKQFKSGDKLVVETK